jgi:hypothetical protein
VSFATTETSTRRHTLVQQCIEEKKVFVERKAAESLLRKDASSFSPILIHTPGVLELVCAVHEVKGGLFSLGTSWRLWLQASIFNKDVLKNPKTGEGPEVAGKKTLEAAAASDTYASRVRLSFRAS